MLRKIPVVPLLEVVDLHGTTETADQARILTFVDLSGNVVGVVTQPEVDTRSTAPKPRAPLGILTLPRIEP
jgi:hypothetical protein